MPNPKPDTGCLFDEIVAGERESHLVAEAADATAFLDIRPVFKGHTLVVPRRHYAHVSDLPPGMAGLLWDLGAQVAAAQRRALGAEGTFYGMNDVISQSVAHVHLHVIPRRAKDGLRGFFWPRGHYDVGEAAAVAAALRQAFAAGLS